MAQPGELDWRRISDHFLVALELDGEARRRLLDELASTDPGIAVEVERLLAGHVAEGVLDRQSMLGLDDEGPEDSPPLAVGTVLAERFEIVREIAQGGIGHVYEARDLELGSAVALKTLRPRLARDERARERFRREVRLARRVTHHNACRLFDMGQDGEIAFLTMELLEGETLAAWLDRNGPLDAVQALAIAGQVAAALDFAHRAGVVHRDLKSGNVMLVEEAGSRRAVVTDFGLATAAGHEMTPSRLSADRAAERLTAAGQLVGTPAVMAPEQVVGGEITPATDLWAFGLLLWEMRTGRLPSIDRSRPTGPALEASEPTPLEPAWRDAVADCLQIDPAYRPTGAGAVVAALSGVRPSEEKSRSRFGAAMAATAAFLLLGLGVAVWQWVLARGSVDGRAGEAAVDEPSFVIVADWTNRTGEEVFDGVVEAVLARELANSGSFRIAPRPRIDDALRLMQRPVDSAVDRDTAREIAVRDEGIGAVLTGTAEKLGSQYVFSAEIVAPETGATTASLGAVARGEDEVLRSLARLARDVRRSLGETLDGLEPPPARYARVTTPSLEAFRLYTKADQLMMRGGDRTIAGELLREAIREDPGFASAYTHLAWCVQDQGERLALSSRALELADRASPAERYFIEGSDHIFHREFESAIMSHIAILQFDPLHWWALNNLVYMQAWNAWDESAPPELATWLRQMITLQPDSPEATYQAAMRSLRENRLEDAARYSETTRRLAAGLIGSNRFRYEHLPLHVDWMRGDVESVLAQVRREAPLVTGPPTGDLALEAHVGWLLTLGRESEALAAIDGARDPEAYRFYRGLASALRGDALAAVSDFSTGFWPNPTREGIRAASLAAAGRVDLARAAIQDLIDSVAGDQRAGVAYQRSYAGVAEGALALSQGQVGQTIATLDALTTEWERDAPGISESDPVFHRGALSLAEAWRLAGRPERALMILEKRRARRIATHQWGRLSWMMDQVALVRLYRQVGRQEEAVALEAEVRDLLRLSEPDFFLLRELDSREVETLLIPAFWHDDLSGATVGPDRISASPPSGEAVAASP